MNIPRIIGMFFVYLLLFAPQTIFAVQISLGSEADSQSHLDTFYIPVRIDTQGECINAVQVTLAYNPEEISVSDISIGDSILTLWTQYPTIEKMDGKEIGRIQMSGGIPGGFCGRVSGDPGQTNLLARLVVNGLPSEIEFNEVKTTQIVIESGSGAFLHDGDGTLASTTYRGIEFAMTHSTTTARNVWLSDIRTDEIAPEDFEITLVKGPSEGSNYHYIAYNTVDKQSGIDHYKVLETDPDRFGFLAWISKEAHWVVGKSPYILRDQNLRSKIMVKAVDKNGNERISTYYPALSPFAEITRPSVFIPLLLILTMVLIIVGIIMIRRKKKKEKNDREHE